MISALENPHLVLYDFLIPPWLLLRNDLAYEVLAVVRAEELCRELKENGLVE